ncbi:MAG: choice-of-anchor D domain-containing protein [Gammaproteobacteria bacterium]
MTITISSRRLPRRLPQLALATLSSLALGASGQALGADAVNGKTLYVSGPTSGGGNCAGCHGATATKNNVQRGADKPDVIAAAIKNVGAMTKFAGKFSQAELADIAAFIANPAVTAPGGISVAPSALAFGATLQGQASAPLTLTLTNGGASALDIAAVSVQGASAADFTVSGGTCAAGASVAAGASCTVQLTFKPGATGALARAASLSITHNGTGGATSVALAGTAPATAQPSIGVSNNAIDFGELAVGALSAPRSITVSNSGLAPLNFSTVGVTGAQADAFTLGGTCASPTPVAPGASCTLTVSAIPRAAGPLSATLTLASDAANGPVQIALSASGGAAAPALAVLPAAVAFGSATVNAPALLQRVSFVNTGSVVVALTPMSVTGAASVTLDSGTCGASLAPGASCDVGLAFAPTSAGAVNATLSAGSGASAVQVAVSATGSASVLARPVLSSAALQRFADAQVGTTSAARSITLRNDGGAPLKLASVALGGADAGDFVLGGTCAVSTPLEPSSSCTLETRFKPAAAGARRAEAQLTTTDGARLVLPLVGSGVTVAAPPALTLAVSSFDFGAVQAGSPSTSRFKLANNGTAPLTLSAIAVTGPFAQVQDATTCAGAPLVLQPGAACELAVTFKPTAAGAATGALTLDGDAGQRWSIALAGQATPAPSTTPLSNQGGGGCSSIRGGSDPMLAFLAVLSVLVLGWRRASARRSARVSATSSSSTRSQP